MLVLGVSRLAQIADSVIAFVFVAVVNQFGRPNAILIEPGKTMGIVKLSINTQPAIASGIDGAFRLMAFGNPTPCDERRENAGQLVVRGRVPSAALE